VSTKNTSRDDVAELTKAERTARDDISDSVEGVATTINNDDSAPLIAPQSTYGCIEPTAVHPGKISVGGPVDVADKIEPTEDLDDDASVSALVEARRDDS
jgi:hypothetical protein